MNRLLIADLKRMWRQGLAISVLLGCGIALFVMSNSSMLSLERSRRVRSAWCACHIVHDAAFKLIRLLRGDFASSHVL